MYERRGFNWEQADEIVYNRNRMCEKVLWKGLLAMNPDWRYATAHVKPIYTAHRWYKNLRGVTCAFLGHRKKDGRMFDLILLFFPFISFFFCDILVLVYHTSFWFLYTVRIIIMMTIKTIITFGKIRVIFVLHFI